MAAHPLEQMTQDLDAATAVLVEPVMAAGARLRHELGLAQRREVTMGEGLSRATYAVRDVELAIHSPHRLLRSRVVRTELLMCGPVIAEDPAAVAELRPGESLKSVDYLERRRSGAAWKPGRPPVGDELRRMANEIPAARSRLVEDFQAALRAAAAGQRALSQPRTTLSDIALG